ncbi:MAG: hypothetical protein R3205_11990, partial [Psychrobacter sp.]|nr:hypothetical protein [Psychrobacter sp.]
DVKFSAGLEYGIKMLVYGVLAFTMPALNVMLEFCEGIYLNSLIKEKSKRHRYLLITVPFVFFSKTIIKPCCLKSLLIA